MTTNEIVQNDYFRAEAVDIKEGVICFQFKTTNKLFLKEKRGLSRSVLVIVNALVFCVKFPYHLLLSMPIGLVVLDVICHIIAAINGVLKKRITTISLGNSYGNHDLLP